MHCCSVVLRPQYLHGMLTYTPPYYARVDLTRSTSVPRDNYKADTNAEDRRNNPSANTQQIGDGVPKCRGQERPALVFRASAQYGRAEISCCVFSRSTSILPAVLSPLLSHNRPLKGTIKCRYDGVTLLQRRDRGRSYTTAVLNDRFDYFLKNGSIWSFPACLQR